MRPLIIDDEIKDKLKNLASYAERNPFTMDDLLDTMNKQLAPAGDMEHYVVHIPFGYKVAFSIEQQAVGDVRHLSMSVDAVGKLPNVIAVEEIMKIIGFKNKLENCVVKLEDIGENRQAINVLEII
ncbi:MAG: hypothetical protein AABY15_03160 [Nanoarchaeota archaeon]